MTGQLNGHNPGLPPDPREPVARAVVEALAEQNDEAETWAELSDEDRDAEVNLAGEYIAAHLAFLSRHSLRVLPMNAVPVPTSVEEANAMVQAAQRFLEARKRKTNLIGGKPKRLILPKGVV
jgi:hypothetical protein